jgi:WD40 repeat protein
MKKAVTWSSPPDSDEFSGLAELAFASRRSVLHQTQVARGLAFLPPDVLDMDLSDPMQRDFGDYELLEKIGQGGMGMVYRAHQKSLDREVALKLLAAGPWASEQFIDRFRREAQSAARLEHPNIVAIFDAGTRHDLHYFSMRLVRGEALSARLRREGPMSTRAAAKLLRVVADAVDYAHRLGVLHLDLKPGNILLDVDGEPMVADFGLARRLDQALAEDIEDVSGTPAYMAPEQAVGRAQSFGRGTDIYGLGCILHEQLTGQPPFLAPTLQATLALVASQPPQPMSKHRRGIPPDLEAICFKCLEKDPDLRYATASDLAEDLRRFLDDRPVSIRKPTPVERIARWVRREPRLAAAGGLIALALAAGLAATSQQWQRAEINAATSQRLLWEGRREAALGLEREGRGIEAMPRLLDNLVEQEAAGDLDAAAGERLRLGLLQSQGATLIDLELIIDANPLAAALDDDGHWLALAFNDRSVRWYDSATLSEHGRVSLAELPTSDAQPRVPVQLEFVDESLLRVRLDWYSNLVSPNAGDSWLVDLNAGQIIMPPADIGEFAEAIFSPDGHHALLRSRSGELELWRTRPWQRIGPGPPIGSGVVSWRLDDKARFAFGLGVAMRPFTLHDLSGETAPTTYEFADEAGISAWTQSGDGRLLALGDFGGRIFLLDLDSGQWRHLPATRAREVTWLAFSEDDAWIAGATFDGSLTLFDAGSGDPIAAGEMRVDFAPRRVSVSRSQRLLLATGEGQSALWRIPRQGLRAGNVQRVGFAPVPHELSGRYPIDWSRQTGLMVTTGIDGQVRLWRLPAAPTSNIQGARPSAESLHYAGSLEVEADWNHLRLVHRGGPPTSPWLELPHPPAFATLLKGGTRLVFTTAAELRVYNAPELSLRHSPVALPATPQRLMASPDGRYVLMSFGTQGQSGLQELIRIFDIESGQWAPGSIQVPGQVRQFVFSPDSESLAIVGPAMDATRLIRRDGLVVLADYPHDPFEPVVAADFRGPHLVLALRAEDRRLGNDRMELWDPRTDVILQRIDLGAAIPRNILAYGERTLIVGDGFDLLIHPDNEMTRLPRIVGGDFGYTAAISPDARLLARGFRNTVQVHDAETGALMGSLRVSDAEALDFIAALAFSPDGSELIANGVIGYLHRWQVGPETRDTRQLIGLAQDLLPPVGSNLQLRMPGRQERHALRARDPGPWHAHEPSSRTRIASNARPGRRIPARPEGLSSAMVDLGGSYNAGPYDVTNVYWNFRPGLHLIPHGLLKIGSVDFDVRGVVQLINVATPGAATPGTSRLDCLPVHSEPVAAVHLLAGIGLGVPAPHDKVLGLLTMHYRDGTRFEQPLRAGRELPGYLDDSAVPILFAADPVSYRSGAAEGDNLAAPRLPNPYPERPLRCVELEFLGEGGILALFAITLEPWGDTARQNDVIATH